METQNLKINFNNFFRTSLKIGLLKTLNNDNLTFPCLTLQPQHRKEKKKYFEVYFILLECYRCFGRNEKVGTQSGKKRLNV